MKFQRSSTSPFREKFLLHCLHFAESAYIDLKNVLIKLNLDAFCLHENCTQSFFVIVNMYEVIVCPIKMLSNMEAYC